MHATPEIAHNVVEAIARHPKTLYRESYYHFHLLSDVDKDDDKFVDCAFKTNARFIVTQDRHFDVLKKVKYPIINIIDVDDFIIYLESLQTR